MLAPSNEGADIGSVSDRWTAGVKPAKRDSIFERLARIYAEPKKPSSFGSDKASWREAILPQIFIGLSVSVAGQNESCSAQ